jgi:hypothetical protein
MGQFKTLPTTIRDRRSSKPKGKEKKVSIHGPIDNIPNYYLVAEVPTKTNKSYK